jgi:hypothetical protein
MSSDYLKDFVKTTYKKYRYIPTIPLGKPVEFGDLLIIGKVGKPPVWLGNIKDPLIGIEVGEIEDTTPSDMKLSSKSGMIFSMKAKGERTEGSIIPVEKAGIVIEFSKRGGYLFEPKGVRFNRIKDLISIRKQILERVPKELLLGHSEIFWVKEIAQVESYAFVSSSSSKSRLEVSADVEIGRNHLAKLNAEADFGLKIAYERDLEDSDIGEKGGNIFFIAEKIRLRDTILNKAKSRTEILLNKEIELTDFEFTDLNIEDVYNMYNFEL